MINIVNKSNHIPTEYDYYIARPNILGNPFSHKKSKFNCTIVQNRELSIQNYEEWFKFKILDKDEKFLNELKKLIDFYYKNENINLVCWCYPKKCHGEIIKKYIEGTLFI
jgi:hypothetical protein